MSSFAVNEPIDTQDDYGIPPPAIVCPRCSKLFKLGAKGVPPPAFWHHINLNHICLGIFPPSELLKEHNRLMCSQYDCHWIYHSRFRRQGCQRPTGNNTKCGGALVDPLDLPTVPFQTTVSQAPSTIQEEADTLAPTPISTVCPHPETTLLEVALEAVGNVCIDAQFAPFEEECVAAILHHLMILPATTIYATFLNHVDLYLLKS